MSEGQVVILLLILIQMAFMLFAIIDNHIETKKLEKRKNKAIIHRKWLRCACECEI